MSRLGQMRRAVRGGGGLEAGLTLVELVVFIGFGSVMIVALVAMIARTFTLSREQLEQGAITEKARVELERMGDEIRNAQYVDCNMDGDTADAGEHWLGQADEFEIIVLSNVDDDVEAEKLRYFVETGVAGEERKLKRGVIQSGGSLCDWSGAESVQTVMDGLRNINPVLVVPMFRYYTSSDDSAILTAPVVRLSSVLRIRLELRIDEADNVNPGEVEIVTDVVPRGVRDPGACVAPGLDVKRYNYTSSSYKFADRAFQECQSYCLGSATLPPGQCCPWSVAFSWQGNPNWYVWAACQCADTYLPPDITPESVNQNAYTTYVKECLEGTRCAGQKGEAICEAGCLDAPGQCVCVCPGGFPSTTTCDDGFDNDNDGTADCTGCDGVVGLPPDPGCTGAADSSEAGATRCDNGADDDGDTLTDFKQDGSGDPDCDDPADDDESAAAPPCVPTEIPGVPQCNDGIDNDCHEDGIDYAGGLGDPECQDELDTNEWHLNKKQCFDGLDNDSDGTFDCPQPACDRVGLPPGDADLDCTDPGDESEFP